MTSQLLDRQAPELVALCRLDKARHHQVVGWAMVVAERVVAYVPEHPHIAGGALLNTYSSLDSAEGFRVPPTGYPELLSAGAARVRRSAHSAQGMRSRRTSATCARG